MMAVTNFLKTYQHHHHVSLPKRKLVTYAVYALIAVALLYLFVDDPSSPPPPAASSNPSSPAPWIQQQQNPERPAPQPPYNHQRQQLRNAAAAADTSSSSATTTSSTTSSCDYADGEWVPDAGPPPYDGTTCGAIKDDGRSCTLNGRPDTGYVHWRWQPRRCSLPPFSAAAFLGWLRDRHVAFVGDSLARNQAESLVCLLSSTSPATLVHRSDSDGGRFRRWVFRGHNATVSIFWSPFLVRGVEKSERDGVRYNQVFLDEFDERWMAELAAIDALVISAGHWFRIPSVYHDGGGKVVGCHGCGESTAKLELNNRTAGGSAAVVPEMSFFDVFRDAVRRTLAEVARRHRLHEHHGGGDRKNSKVVAVTTFSPSHFEGQWNEGAPCKKKPDRELGYTETEMRRIVVDAVDEAAEEEESVMFAAVDVTALANLRPDGHPGPYMHKNPFSNTTSTGGRVQHDCLHWCMPGPVDTFNQILLQTILSGR